MGDSVPRRRRSFRVQARALLVAAVISAPLIACGRTTLEQSQLSDETSAAIPAGGAFAGSAIVGGAASESRAGSGVGAPISSAGHAGVNGVAGAIGSVFGGGANAGGNAGGEGGNAGAGAAGADDSLFTLPRCERAQTPVLDGPLAYETQAAIQASVTGDWNSDGKLDLATSNSDGSLTVLFGSGDGSFTSSVRLPTGLESRATGTGASSIATLDLDGNGTRDLVVAQSAVSGIAVLLSKADGSFASSVTHSLKRNVIAFALGDFTADTIADIVVASDNGTVSLLEGVGDGSFGDERVTSTAANLTSIAAGDLNHDGRLDVVVVGSSEGAVLLGDGAGGFVKSQAFETTTEHNTVTIGDFNSDGKSDLALTVTCDQWPNPQSSLEVLLGHGDGTFASRDTYPGARSCLPRIAVADVNRDGALDLVTSAVSALLGKGDGSFLPDTMNAKASGGNLLGLGDFDGDGRLDVATYTDDWVEVHLGQGDGTFGSNEIYDTGSQPHSLALADFDRNGTLDAVTALSFSYHGFQFPSSLSVLLGPGNGTFPEHVQYDTPDPNWPLVVVDLNGDGVHDLVTLRGNSTVAVSLGAGDGAFSPQQSAFIADNEQLIALAVGDLSGDGRPDVAVAADSGMITLLFGNGDGTLSSRGSVQPPARAEGVALLDANHDAKLDLVFTLPELGTVGVLLGNGDGNFLWGRQYRVGRAQPQITAADLNADGQADLVTWGNESFSILLGAADGSFGRRTSYVQAASRIVAADIDQNGTLDLVTNSYPGFSALLGAGDGSLTCAARYALGIGMDGLAVGDLDRDGRMDVATTMNYGLAVFLNRSP